jgi:phosphohistidine phosphatase
MNLWVIRHAKSSWADEAQSDFDRPLKRRGEKDGKRMMRWMRDQDARPEQIISSDSARTRATAEFVREGYGLPADRLRFDHRLYAASADVQLAVLRELSAGVASVALVAHNPGATEFVNALAGQQVIENLPTFGIAMLNVPLPWSGVSFGCATFIAVHTPKAQRDQGKGDVHQRNNG